MRFKKPVFWDRKNPSFFSYLLFPLSLITMLIGNNKKRAINKYPNIKTICVGNIYIGGTGKTSLALKIKEILDQKKIKVCFIKKFHLDQIDEQKLLSKNGQKHKSINQPSK